MGAVLAEIDAHLVQDGANEWIGFAGFHAGRGHIDPVAVEMLHDGGRHG